MQSDFLSDIFAVTAVVEVLLFSCGLVGEVDVLKSSKESNSLFTL